MRAENEIYRLNRPIGPTGACGACWGATQAKTRFIGRETGTKAKGAQAARDSAERGSGLRTRAQGAAAHGSLAETRFSSGARTRSATEQRAGRASGAQEEQRAGRGTKRGSPAKLLESAWRAREASGARGKRLARVRARRQAKTRFTAGKFPEQPRIAQKMPELGRNPYFGPE
ncbi:hypothetical protein GH714_028627 [Hevea brasiliensis]|uniref:Uncharacterized protein n=1 Tax=Hevea brasiliensis TaxID=3981 RepID=A0A6A6LX30_HEVBR|nr:hypothetical protein GH714_028627 [Hevea brasiliensis]